MEMKLIQKKVLGLLSLNFFRFSNAFHSFSSFARGHLKIEMQFWRFLWFTGRWCRMLWEGVQTHKNQPSTGHNTNIWSRVTFCRKLHLVKTHQADFWGLCLSCLCFWDGKRGQEPNSVGEGTAVQFAAQRGLFGWTGAWGYKAGQGFDIILMMHIL